MIMPTSSPWIGFHQPTVFFSQNKSATSNQPTVLSSQNKSTPAISQTNKLMKGKVDKCRLFVPIIDHLKKLSS
jgi:hypothetical protein